MFAHAVICHPEEAESLAIASDSRRRTFATCFFSRQTRAGGQTTLTRNEKKPEIVWSKSSTLPPHSNR